MCLQLGERDSLQILFPLGKDRAEEESYVCEPSAEAGGEGLPGGVSPRVGIRLKNWKFLSHEKMWAQKSCTKQNTQRSWLGTMQVTPLSMI